VFLHSMVSTGHVLHSGGSRAQNVTALLLMLGWDHTDLRKSYRTSYAEFVSLHPVGSYYFSCLGGSSGTDSTKTR
jgi:hypothetical protein